MFGTYASEENGPSVFSDMSTASWKKESFLDFFDSASSGSSASKGSAAELLGSEVVDSDGGQISDAEKVELLGSDPSASDPLVWIMLMCVSPSVCERV